MLVSVQLNPVCCILLKIQTILNKLLFLSSEKLLALGAVHEGRPHKIDLLLPFRTGSTPSPLSIRTPHKFRKIWCFLHQKVWTHLKNLPCPLWIKSPDHGHLLWTAPYAVETKYIKFNSEFIFRSRFKFVIIFTLEYSKIKQVHV